MPARHVSYASIVRLAAIIVDQGNASNYGWVVA
jgi:hypothetical protein